MTEQITQYSIALIAAFATIIGAIIGAGASLCGAWMSRKAAEAGRIDVFCRIVFSKLDKNGFGFHGAGQASGLVFRIPMWLELANTAMVAKYIRDFNVVAYNGWKKVADFTQLQGTNIGKDNMDELGNHQFYSFVVDGKTIQRYNVEFALKEAELQDANKDFNILKVRYYDDSGKKIERVFFKRTGPFEWKIGTIDYKKEWINVSRRNSLWKRLKNNLNPT